MRRVSKYLVEVLAGRLLGAREHRAHHHNGGAARDRLVRGRLGLGLGLGLGLRLGLGLG